MKRKLILTLLILSTIFSISYFQVSSTLFEKLIDNMPTSEIETITISIPFGTPNDTYVFDDVESVNIIIDSLKETKVYNSLNNSFIKTNVNPKENEPHIIFFNRNGNHSLYTINFNDRSIVKVGSKYYRIKNNILFDKIQLLIEQRNSI